MGTIRSELRRFERRRLRPLFRLLRLGRSRPRTPALIADAARVPGGQPVPEIEELLVAMIREEIRRDAPSSAAGAIDGLTGSPALDSFVRAMLAMRPAGESVCGTREAA
jgi:hypothetical protein